MIKTKFLKIAILLLVTQSVTAQFNPQLRIGDISESFFNVAGVTIDSLTVNADTTDSYYKVTIEVHRSKVLPNPLNPTRDTVVIDTNFVSESYILGEEVNDELFNSVVNSLTPTGRALYLVGDRLNLISAFTPLNSVTSQLNKPNLLQQLENRFNPQHTGYWQLTYNTGAADTTRLFRIDSTANIIEIEEVGNDVQDVAGGFSGVVWYYGNAQVGLRGLNNGSRQLVEGLFEFEMGSRPSENFMRYLTRVGVEAEFKRMPPSFQAKTLL